MYTIFMMCGYTPHCFQPNLHDAVGVAFKVCIPSCAAYRPFGGNLKVCIKACCLHMPLSLKSAPLHSRAFLQVAPGPSTVSFAWITVDMSIHTDPVGHCGLAKPTCNDLYIRSVKQIIMNITSIAVNMSRNYDADC